MATVEEIRSDIAGMLMEVTLIDSKMDQIINLISNLRTNGGTVITPAELDAIRSDLDTVMGLLRNVTAKQDQSLVS